MRFGLIHRVMTDALAALGLLSLVTSGELGTAVSIAMVVGMVGAIALPERFQDRTPLRQLAVVAPVVLLLTQAVRLFLGAPVLELAVEFAAGLQIVRLATRRGAAHDQQVIVLALLHLIAGTVLGTGLAYGLCFLGFLLVAPGALVLSHLRREVEGNYRQGARDRTGLPVDVPRILRSRRVIGKQFLLATCLLSVPIFVFTAVLFVMFPRVGLSLLLLNHGRPERMVGFSDKVDLGGVGKLRSDPTIAMRVEYADLPEEPPPRVALYLRGTAFDSYDGRSWARTGSRRFPANQHGREVIVQRLSRPSDRKLTIELEAIDPPVLFLPANTVSLTLRPRGSRAPIAPGHTPAVLAGPEGEFKYRTAEERGITYEVSYDPGRAWRVQPLRGEERARHLSLPPRLPARVGALARTWVGAETSPVVQARLIESHLRRDYRYDLASPSGASANPLDDFLFNSKRGHCEFYSTAMAIMLRTLDVPTRNVTGFIGGTFNRYGRYYAVRQGDAHSWVEVHLPKRGWVRFDPTPPGNSEPVSDVDGLLASLRDLIEATAQRWDRHIVGYDLEQQLGLWNGISQKYAETSRSSRVLRALGSPRRAALLVGGGLTLVGAVYLWRRRRRKPIKRQVARRDARARRAVLLYEAIDQVLARRGVPRPASVPPLHHARALQRLKHPIGDELVELTLRYLDARFGGRPLEGEEHERFMSRVRALGEVPPVIEQAA